MAKSSLLLAAASAAVAAGAGAAAVSLGRQLHYVAPFPCIGGNETVGTWTGPCIIKPEQMIPYKWMDAIPKPGIAKPSSIDRHGVPLYKMGLWQKKQTLHSVFGHTPVYTYGANDDYATASFPGPTIEVLPNQPLSVNWINHLPQNSHILGTPDPLTIMDENAHGGTTSTGTPEVRIVTHVHGAHVDYHSDGGPDSWYTSGNCSGASSSSSSSSHTGGMRGLTGSSNPSGCEVYVGPEYYGSLYNYSNDQLATTLWYHDHALGITRLNVYAGLAGFYLIQDPIQDAQLKLPTGDYDIPLAIQDRSVTVDYQLYWPQPYLPEFFGNLPVVNGIVYGNLRLEPNIYRLRLLNGCTAAFLNIRIESTDAKIKAPGFVQIASEGGLLPAPVPFASMQSLLIAPAERPEILVDLRGYSSGTKFIVTNDAPGPYPMGDPPVLTQLFQIEVVAKACASPGGATQPGRGLRGLSKKQSSKSKSRKSGKRSSKSKKRSSKSHKRSSRSRSRSSTNLNSNSKSRPDPQPPSLCPSFSPPSALPPIYPLKRTDNNARKHFFLNEQTVMTAYGFEVPLSLIDNSTWDDPITTFVPFNNVEDWTVDNWTVDAHPIHLHLVQFQVIARYNSAGAPSAWTTVAANEKGWKDTVVMYPCWDLVNTGNDCPPGTATTVIRAKFDLPGKYPIHCHILTHEDFDMMRPYVVLPPPPKPDDSGKVRKH